MATTSQGPPADSPPKQPQDQLEMSTLPASTSTAANTSDPTPSAPQQPPTISPPADAPDLEDTTAGAEQPSSLPSEQNPRPSPPNSDPITTRLTRAASEALGPATESPITPPTATGPTLSITLMLTTGARHPYKIDERYLRSRKVDLSGTTETPAHAAAASGSGSAGDSATFDPREISGYKLKELVWTDWRSEWEPRPPTPSSIRLIIMGRLVEDKALLKDFPFKLHETNVVHMTVKPADFLDDDDGTAAKGTGKGHSIRGRDDGEGGAGCRCVIL